MQKTEISASTIAPHLNKLVTFAAVAKRGSITHAAKDVHLSQSAVSHLIANLETVLGVKLFRRKSRGLELTEQGNVLLNFSNQIHMDLEALSLRLAHSNRSSMGIRVGTYMA